MKKWYRFLFLPVLILALVGCDDDREYVNLHSPKDGIVTQLQKHTIGKGVPIVILVDRFTEADITSGNYRKATNWALEGLFSQHPMKSLREYFDVYEVTAASYTNNSNEPVFGAWLNYGDGFPSVNYVKPVTYATRAIGEERIEDAVIIILIPAKMEEGESCRSFADFDMYPPSDYDIPTGHSLAHVELQIDRNGAICDNNYGTLLHEAIGHGFAKLADEYYSEVDDETVEEIDDETWEVVDDSIYDLGPDREQRYGCFMNLSFDNDVTKSYWADFAADSRYDFEKLGCYEGAHHTLRGIYRPTENSIMRYGSGYFNVVHRVLIYKRCMRIAYGDSWKFDYEEFVKFDLEKAIAEYRAYHDRQHPSVYVLPHDL